MNISIQKFLLAACLSVTSVWAMAQQKPIISRAAARAMEKASASEIKADITYLADDKLLGRMPGTPGFQSAVDYVTSRLESMNVAPAGENGTWLQTVHLRKVTTARGASIVLTRQSLGDGNEADSVSRNIVITANPQLPQVNVQAPLAFVGYGISQPKLNYDDYAGIDVKGKIIIIIRGAPDQFSSSVRSHVMNTTTLLKTAAEHGAIGVIIGSAVANSRFPAGNAAGTYSVLDAGGKVVVSRSFYSVQVKLLANMSYLLFNSLAKQAGYKLQDVISAIKSGKTNSFEIPAALNIAYQSMYKDIVSYNIVGKITGSDARLKKEYVVHSAHLDHLGIGRPVEGDSIYNGAHDNASGVASLIQIAGIYKNLPKKPKRSILVVMVTGEEMGDLGSGYFAAHPTVPKSSIVADVNTDMPAIIAPLLSVTALGAEHSSLSNQVNQAAAYLNLTVEPDPEPEQNRFVRSDQYSFVVQGIPALHIKYGNKTPDGKNNLNEFVQQWRARYYHKPQDDINGVFDFDAGRKYAQLNFLIGYLVANDKQRPVWNKGDIFEVHQVARTK